MPVKQHPARRPMVIVMLGVAGSGKSTVGELLAERLGCSFYEGDDYHPQANKQKMRQGLPLTDDDRWPWLAAIRKLISETLHSEQSAIVACSALRRAYRDCLRQEGVMFVYLKGDYKLICERLEKRRGHFFDPELLASQFRTLEEPRHAVVVDISKSAAEVAEEIERKLEDKTIPPGKGID